MPFPKPLDLRVLPKGRYKVLAAFPYIHDKYGEFVVPAGEVTDLASIPRWARWLVTGHEETREPAVIHDYLYSRGLGTRKWADQMFRDGMKEKRAPGWKWRVCYWAVRVGGSGWNGEPD